MDKNAAEAVWSEHDRAYQTMNWRDTEWLRQCVLVPCLGLALLRYWVMTLSENASVFSSDPAVYLTMWVARGVAPLLAVTLLSAKPLKIDTSAESLVPSAILASAGGLCLHWLWPQSSGIVPLAGALLGYGAFGWLYVCWHEIYRSMRIHDVALSIMTSLLASSVLAGLETLCPGWVQEAGIALAPLAVALLFYRYERRGEPATRYRTRFSNYLPGQMMAINGRWFAMLAVYSLILGAIHVISTLQARQSGIASDYGVYIGASCMLSVVFIVMVLGGRQLMSPKTFWTVIVGAIGLSFVLVLLYPETLQMTLSVFAAIRYVAFGYINVKLIDIAHHSRTPVYVVFAAGWGVIQLCMAAGAILALYLLDDLGMALDIVAVMLLAVLAMGTLLLASNSNLSDVFIGDESPDREREELGRGEDPAIAAAWEARSELLRAQCRSLRARCGLTEREAEIVYLLAQGHTQAYCAEALVVSINTIRSHMKHIYSKMDIHSKDELLSELAQLP